MFTLEAKPLLTDNLIEYDDTISTCSYLSPNTMHIIIEDLIEDSISVGFEQAFLSVQEPDKRVRIPIIRNGDVSKPFSVICHTRHLTAIEDKDFIGRYSLEKSRIHFNPGERLKYCTVEIIDDSIFEADEEFQVKLSDLRGPEDAKFSQFTSMLVKIVNDEDCKYNFEIRGVIVLVRNRGKYTVKYKVG